MNQQLRPSVLEARICHDAVSAQPLYTLCSEARELDQHPVSEEQQGLRSFISSKVPNAAAAGLVGTWGNGDSGGIHHETPTKISCPSLPGQGGRLLLPPRTWENALVRDSR